jgi:hypothetical protein
MKSPSMRNRSRSATASAQHKCSYGSYTDVMSDWGAAPAGTRTGKGPRILRALRGGRRMGTERPSALRSSSRRGRGRCRGRRHAAEEPRLITALFADSRGSPRRRPSRPGAAAGSDRPGDRRVEPSSAVRGLRRTSSPAMRARAFSALGAHDDTRFGRCSSRGDARRLAALSPGAPHQPELSCTSRQLRATGSRAFSEAKRGWTRLCRRFRDPRAAARVGRAPPVRPM